MATITIQRATDRDRFTVIDRAVINDERLSIRALGLITWLLDKPDGWNFSSDSLAQMRKEGRDALRTAIRELEAVGYLERRKTQDAKGHWHTTLAINETAPTTGFQAPVDQPVVSQASLEKTEERRLNNSLPLEAENPTADDPFEAMWKTYPRKVNKAGARAKYLARVHQGADPAEMQRAVTAYAEHCRREQTADKYILHGETFFGPKQRWQDWVPKPGDDEGKFYDEDGDEISESAYAAQRNGDFMRSAEARRWA